MLRRVGCALVAGLALWSAFPSLGWWPLAVVGVALLALATSGVRPRTGFLIGLLAGYAYFGPLISWSGVYVGTFPWFSLATLQALYVGLLGLVCAILQRGDATIPAPRSSVTRATTGATVDAPTSPRIRPLAVALAWVAYEWARGHTPFGGFPWGRLAFSQADGPFARLAALGGAPAVTFGVALCGALLALAIRRARTDLFARRADSRARPDSRARRDTVAPGESRGRDGSTAQAHSGGHAHGAAAALAGAVAVLLAGLLVPVPTGTGEGAPTARIVGIQGNVPTAGLDFNAQRRAVLDNHARVTTSAAQDIARTGAPRPDLVLWPENASDIDPLLNADAAAVIRSAVATIGAPTVVGAVLSGPGEFVSNTSLLYLPDGAIADRYSKLRPVPFAEYIPYRSFFRLFSDKVDLVTRDFAPGDSIGLFRVPTASGGTLAVGLNICFEVAVDDVVRDSVRAGANLISIQTNNATFGFTDESVQQLAISRIRAIEHGRSVAHVSNVGVSALITPDGTPHQSTSLFTSAVLSGDLPLRSATTLATRVGAWPEWLACVAVLVLLALRPRSGRTRESQRGSSAEPEPTAPTRRTAVTTATAPPAGAPTATAPTTTEQTTLTSEGA